MAKTFLNLKPAECIEVTQVIFDNSDALYNSALILADSKDYGRASTLLINSLEEGIKGAILFLDGNGFQFRRVSGIKAIFSNHRLRYPLAFILFVLSVIGKDVGVFIKNYKGSIKDLLTGYASNPESFFNAISPYVEKKIDILISDAEWFDKIESLRQRGIYVDYSDNLISPNMYTQADYARTLESVSNVRLALKEILPGFNLKKASEVSKAQMKSTQEEFLSKGWYEKLGLVIKSLKGPQADPFENMINKLKELKANNNNDLNFPKLGNEL